MLVESLTAATVVLTEFRVVCVRYLCSSFPSACFGGQSRQVRYARGSDFRVLLYFSISYTSLTALYIGQLALLTSEMLKCSKIRKFNNFANMYNPASNTSLLLLLIGELCIGHCFASPLLFHSPWQLSSSLIQLTSFPSLRDCPESALLWCC